MASASLNKMTVPLASDQSASAQGLLMPKLKYRFRVLFQNFGVSNETTELTKQVVSVARPNLTFEEIALPIYNSTLKLAGRHTWADIACSVRDDASGSVMTLVGEQFQKQLDFLEQASAAAGIDYKFVTNIQILDGGNGATDKFVAKVKALISNHDFDGAIAECDRQKGSLANVVHEGILKYQFVQNDTTMDKEAKVHAIQKSIEEATALELPMLSKNMVVISTMASIGTLAGLIGTVVGMIRAFAALSAAGAPDTSALATGISEALVNTLVGILTSALAIIFYNYFSNRIDQITYAMDEAGFSIIQEFQASGK